MFVGPASTSAKGKLPSGDSDLERDSQGTGYGSAPVNFSLTKTGGHVASQDVMNSVRSDLESEDFDLTKTGKSYNLRNVSFKKTVEQKKGNTITRKNLAEAAHAVTND